MSIYNIVLIAVVAVLLAIFMKSIRNEYALYISIIACIFIFFAGLSKLKGVVEMIKTIKDSVNIDDAYLNALIKIIGISYLSEFAADLCRESGFVAMSNQIGIFGKLSIIALSMPVINALITTISGFLS